PGVLQVEPDDLAFERWRGGSVKRPGHRHGGGRLEEASAIHPDTSVARNSDTRDKMSLMQKFAGVFVIAALAFPALLMAKEGDAKLMPNACATQAIGDWSNKPAWNGWGAGLTNARFQTDQGAQITPQQVNRLKLKWAFGFPGAKAVYGQPTVAAGRV